MDEKLLKKTDIGKLYDELKNEYNIYAPTKVKGTLLLKRSKK